MALQKLKLIDEIIPEPLGGAHRNIHDTVYNVERYIVRTLSVLKRTKVENLLENRYKKLRAIGSDTAGLLRTKTKAIKIDIKAAAPTASGKSKRIPAKV